MDKLFSGFGRKVSEIFSPKESQKLAEFRLLPSYRRLKSKFENFPKNKGVDNFGFTIEDICDVANLYTRCVEINGGDHILNNIKGIAKDFTNGQEKITNFDTMLEKLTLDQEISDSIRKLPIDIERILAINKSRTGVDYAEISHYPGGIVIRRMAEVSEKPNGFCIFFTNRQRSDNGHPVNKIFHETGVPIKSNITD